MMSYFMHQSNYIENVKDELGKKMNNLGVELELPLDRLSQKKNSLKITKL